MRVSLFHTLLLALSVVGTITQAVTIRNLGCKTYDQNQVCTECSTRFYLDKDYICQPVNPNCKTYNSNNGACLSCYPGFGIVEDTCLPGAVTPSYDPNCNTFNGSVCAKCSKGFFLGSSGKCTVVSPSCNSYDSTNGDCTSCFAGYAVEKGKCVVSVADPTVANCNQLDPLSGACLKCSKGYYFDFKGNCVQENPTCKYFDSFLKQCTECYPGYALNSENVCIKEAAKAGDPNCKTFNNGICVECAKGAIFNVNGLCITVDPSCASHSELDGSCISCYAGYKVSNRTCIKQETQVGDPNCKTFRNGVCVECSQGAFFNLFGICTITDPSCATHDQNNGSCTSCYSGYALSDLKICVKAQQGEKDPNCKSFSGTKCVECSFGAIFNQNGKCIMIDPSCFTFNQDTGDCTSCYPGYQVSSKTCILSNSTDSRDPFCKSFLQNVCVECSLRYFVNHIGRCEEVSPLCKQYNNVSGVCLSCYPGFKLTSPTCLQEQKNITDEYCKTWKNEKCTECSFGAFFLPNGTCKAANPLCKTFDSYGLCSSCYDSFEVQNGNCVKSTQSLSDPNCAQFFGEVCLQCSKGFIFLDTGKCGLVNSNCRDYNSMTGECTSCYMGYVLSFGKCINSTNDVSAIDVNCAQFNGSVCAKCSKNFFFKDGLCTAVDPLCNGFNPSTGSCTGCYESFVLSGNRCIEDKNHTLTDPNCASWLQGVCIKCATRTFMNSQGLCSTISIDCNTYSPDNGYCTSCYPGFSVKNGVCLQDKSPSSCNKFNPDGSCAICGKGSYLSQGSCILIDPSCANFDNSAFKCLGCYPGYSLLSGVCQVSVVDSKYEVTNCYAYDSTNQCIKCYDRFFLSSNQCQPVDVFCKTYDDLDGLCLSCYSSFTLQQGKCIQ